MSQEAEPYQQALAGVRQALEHRKPEIPVSVHMLGGGLARARAAILEARQAGAAIVALGSVAAQASVLAAADLPVVAALIPYPGELKNAPTATGILLDFSSETHFQWMRRFLPAARKVGVLYNPVENGERILAAGLAAAKSGFRLEAVGVREPKELPSALEKLARSGDILWGISDSLVLNPETARQILLVSFRSRLPLVGPSAGWVKAGALYALQWDYMDLGLQAGELVMRALQNPTPPSPRFAFPRKVLYAVNQRTAQYMKIDLSETLLRGASEVY